MTESLGVLIGDVSHLIRKRFDMRARMVGATRAQWKTLLTVSRNPGINQGMLADRLEVEPITAGRMIDRLEESGLVERRRDPADRRVWRIHLTDAATPVLARLRGYADELFGEAVDGMSAGEQAELTRLLQHIRTNLSTTETQEAAHG